ncbi:large subunit ribosomal protein L26e [Nematocida homosporus]|uniref:large subunit ribosomal protein L26e n=1 Tax=Nematocida homosporus TaxID=1912981 RepID=UPI00221FEF3F|nr:large subunit ribosomal protein L26e [Nematocida homosporus]KAI5186538.1 large subunit ribosomal protein L26e [Nematocida homosporus]
MKFNRKVSSSRRKCRKAHFTANDAKRRLIMSCGLSKELREQYVFRSFPVVKGDEVLVLKGDLKGKSGKVIKVNRATYRVYLDISYRNKKNGQIARFGVHSSGLQITKFCMDHNRAELLEKKKKARLAEDQRKAELVVA